MFGKYYRTLDDKNRIVIPTKILKELGSNFFITIGLDRSLVLRTAAEFNKLKSRLEENNELDKEIRNLKRIIFANTEELVSDRLGRVTFPKHLLEKITIKKEVVFIGTGSQCEIFAKEEFDKNEEMYENEENLDKLAESLFEKGVKL
ncbi:cell division/cell wall cluster transcriptional repressor MraZ [Metamycoplasma hyosynoviae]|uniref:Transcriptional regulator MraZ n=1 Tax=Metamycoplasma hyosynoviae TaxID=29559 RepID=A0A9Q9F314_9BACT|nr:cell division/cell wall cluster transcriptional repressor MraZ [Metamycoplasma hyosynoviae]UTO26276.1 cell division/cell wall cluster transcriptional repressor MraZ [Metamycoplasma hyosynoviae]UTO27082.1 cell division/cell wall cluster transcriptional repressor MraZ [Metamycoplasma hyosynoviae]